MQLFLRKQLREFAIEKYGSMDKLEEHRRDWTAAKVQRKEKRYSAKMADLRKKTRTDTWSSSVDKNPLLEKSTSKGLGRHKHIFTIYDDSKKCSECGFVVKFEPSL